MAEFDLNKATRRILINGGAPRAIVGLQKNKQPAFSLRHAVF